MHFGIVGMLFEPPCILYVYVLVRIWYKDKYYLMVSTNHTHAWCFIWNKHGYRRRWLAALLAGEKKNIEYVRDIM